MNVPPPPIRPRRPWWFWALLSGSGCLLLLVLLVGFIGCLAVLGSSGGDSSGQDSGGKGSPSDAVNSDQLFTNDNYGELFSDPDAYQGEQVDITGQLLGRPENSGGELAFQMFADPENVEWNTVVYTEQTDLDLNTDDYVRVQGEVLGSFDGENAFGGGVIAPSIQASKVTSVSAGEAIDPAQEVREINQTLGDQGFDVTLGKIEFGEKSTRAYVVLTNGTKRGASFYTFDAKIQQGSTQADYLEDSYAYYDEEPQSELRPGVKTEGVVVFEPVDPDQPFELVVPWTSNNYNVNSKPIVFQVTP